MARKRWTTEEKLLVFGAAGISLYFLYTNGALSGLLGGSPATAAEEAESAAATVSNDAADILGL